MTLFPSASTHRVEEVGQDLLLKHLSSDRLLAAFSARPESVEDVTREPAVYRSVLTPLGIGPRCLASGEDWVLLERIWAPELWQIGERSVWVEVAQRLAELHRLLAGTATSGVPLLVYDAALYIVWRDRAKRVGAPEAVLAAHERACERLLAQPPVILHGDFYPSNILVEAGPPLVVSPVDWELTSRGPAVLDLAALVSGWDSDGRDEMAAAYFEAATPLGSIRSAKEALDAARLHLCVQWLGAPTGWEPPPLQAHDWLAEALELSEQILRS